MASGCDVLSAPHLICVLSFAGENAPTRHPEASRVNQNIKIQAEDRDSAESVTTTRLLVVTVSKG